MHINTRRRCIIIHVYVKTDRTTIWNLPIDARLSENLNPQVPHLDNPSMITETFDLILPTGSIVVPFWDYLIGS